MTEKLMQRKYYQLQLLKQQLAVYLEEKQLIDAKTNEIMSTISALMHLKEVKNATKLWSPLGAGCFVQSESKQVKNVAVNIGAGVIAKKKISDAVDILKKRLATLSEADKEITKQINKMAEQATVLENELEQYVRKKEGDSAAG
jgi:prefoldin alpha subunit